MQVPAPFEYERATSVDNAIALLERLGSEARLIAGGHSLLPMMRLRLAQPECVIDINGLADLDYIRVEGDEVAVGALTRHASLLESAVVGEHFALVHDAERLIADPVVRLWGTVGGSFCQADPAEDLSAVGSALKATMVIRSSSGERRVPAVEFHAGPYETAVGPAELLTEVRLPIRPGSGSAYEKVKRKAGDWATAAAGAYVVLSGGTISDAGIGLTALGADHFTAAEAEDFLAGKQPTVETFAEAGDLAAAATDPQPDQRGPVEYKRHLAKELTVRALRRAVQRAEGSPGR